jgi:hypothetical protein
MSYHLSILHVIKMTNVSYIGHHVTRVKLKKIVPLLDRNKSFDLQLDSDQESKSTHKF